MRWIKSGGGPLVVAERRLASSWCGAFGTAMDGVCVSSETTDYARACTVALNYSSLIDVELESVLVLGDIPMLTSVSTISGVPCIVSIVYAPRGLDVLEYVARLDASQFPDELESVLLDVRTEDMVIFDSAASGREIDQEDALEFAIAPARYRTSTRAISDDDQEVSLIVHQLVSLY
jgi:hypothetical protein